MKNFDVQFTLTYKGASSDDYAIDLYDVSQALVGFQRSLALTTHLVLNGEIITQSPALKGAEIYALPAEEGSWKINAGIAILSTAAYQVLTTPNDNPLGHIVYSVYDYVISESLGFHVDYDKSLGELYEENEIKKSKLPKIKESQVDSLIEKCSHAITEIHRPIYKTQTAEFAKIDAIVNHKILPLQPEISMESFLYIVDELIEEEIETIIGRVSSYNSNTYKGRIYSLSEIRPISFELSNNTRNNRTIEIIIESLSSNALRSASGESEYIYCKVHKVMSKTGYLKKYILLEVSKKPFN
jgi:hypothetical protein